MPAIDRPAAAAPADAGSRPDIDPASALCLLDPDRGCWRLADPRTPQLCASDPAVAAGDGVFETVLARRGVPIKLPAHLQRMAAAAEACALPMPAPALWTGAASAAAAALGTAEEAMLRLVLARPPARSGGVHAWVHAEDLGGRHAHARRHGVDVLLLPRPFRAASAAEAPWQLLAVKSLSYAANLAALRHARARGADDAIFVDADGRVLEGATSSVAIARCDDGTRRLIAPHAPGAVLPGTTQAALFDLAGAAGWAVEERPLAAADLFTADGVWLLSSLRLAAPVNRIDGRPLARSPALNAELQALLAAIS